MFYKIFHDKTVALIMGFSQNLLYHCSKLAQNQEVGLCLLHDRSSLVYAGF